VDSGGRAVQLRHPTGHIGLDDVDALLVGDWRRETGRKQQLSIVSFRFPTMLARYDVVKLMLVQSNCLWKQAVFTTVSGPFCYQLAQFR